MKYKDFYINETMVSDVQRKSSGKKVHCDGICFRIHADYDYEIQIGEFAGAYGFEIDDSRESVLQFVRKHIDENIESYRTKQFYALIKKNFENFCYDVRQYPEEYDVLESAEKISNMKKAYECLMEYKYVNPADMHYMVTLKRPLETICEHFSQDKMLFVKEFCKTISRLARYKIDFYGYVDEGEGEKEILDVEENEAQHMAMR